MVLGIVERLVRGLVMARSGFAVIAEQPKLLVLAILPGICLMGLLGMIIFSPIVPTLLSLAAKAGRDAGFWMIIGALLLAYFIVWFVMVFFNVALVACAIDYFERGETSLLGGLSVACSRFVQIAAWAAFASTVGLVLSVITALLKRYLDVLGEVFGSLFEASWAVLTYFVVPVLAVEGVGPFDAIERSLSVMKRAWGEMVGGEFGLRVVWFLLMLPLGLIPREAYSASVIVVVVGYAALITALMHAVDGVLRSALFYYGVTGQSPRGFGKGELAGVFQPRSR